MKQKPDTTRKQPQTASVKIPKHICGTLLYIAECRHVSTKDGFIRSAPPPEGSARITRE